VENSLTLDVERPVAGGRMLARHDGRIVLVSGAIPGERVRARVERTTRSVLWAEATEILQPSDDRRVPAQDPACGGALYTHVQYPRQLQLKSAVIADAFHRIGKLDLPAAPEVSASPETGYRLRARLHVRGRQVGFFREGSHVICEAGPTRQLHGEAMTAIDALAAGLGDQLADCDGLVVSENVAATERVLHVLPRAGRRLEHLRLSVDRLPHVTGVTIATPDAPLALDGRGVVTDTAAELFGGESPVPGAVSWTRNPASFFQANRFLIGALVRRVLAAGSADHCVDLYAGVGLFAVALAAQGSRVVAVEGDEAGARDLLMNAGPWGDRLRVAHAAVEGFLRRYDGPRPGALVLDPPRTGVSPEALAEVIRWGVPRVVYVSCDPPTLARDAARLTAAGYSLESVDAFDLFPNTPHVEVVAVLGTRPLHPNRH
jgi:23S rRNA (uracil1939-C5)-methyltransferase